MDQGGEALRECETEQKIERRDAIIAAGVTLVAALVVVAITNIFEGDTGETIGMVMTPAVLGIGTIVITIRERSWPYKLALIGGPVLLTFLIGWAAA